MVDEVFPGYWFDSAPESLHEPVKPTYRVPDHPLINKKRALFPLLFSPTFYSAMEHLPTVFLNTPWLGLATT
jgi:hypothetical protein